MEMNADQVERLIKTVDKLNKNLSAVREMGPQALSVLGALAKAGGGLKVELRQFNRIFLAIAQKSGNAAAMKNLLDAAVEMFTQPRRRRRRGD
jgi:hypothetical protein